MMVLSNRYGQSFSNFKVLESVPSLTNFRAFFISSHSKFIGRVMSAPDPSAPSVGYVENVEDLYGKP